MISPRTARALDPPLLFLFLLPSILFFFILCKTHEGLKEELHCPGGGRPLALPAPVPHCWIRPRDEISEGYRERIKYDGVINVQQQSDQVATLNYSSTTSCRTIP